MVLGTIGNLRVWNAAAQARKRLGDCPALVLDSSLQVEADDPKVGDL